MLRFYLNLMSNTLICPIQNNDQHDTNRMFTSYVNIKTCNAWYPQNGQANICCKIFNVCLTILWTPSVRGLKKFNVSKSCIIYKDRDHILLPNIAQN